MLRALVFGLAIASPALHAGDVYVWTDADGRRQISDVVPDKYRARAKRVEVPPAPAPAAAADTRSAAAGGSAAPVQPVAPLEANCSVAWSLYLESQECLAFNESALRGLDADPRAGCPVAPAPPAQCPPPPEGISSK